MPQLPVRNLEKELVDRLKKRAGEHGVSTEEEHRRILRATLFDDEAKKIGMTFKEHLLAMPDLEDDSIFERDRTLNGRGSDPHLFEAGAIFSSIRISSANFVAGTAATRAYANGSTQSMTTNYSSA